MRGIFSDGNATRGSNINYYNFTEKPNLAEEETFGEPSGELLGPQPPSV